jgi:mannose-6-phosphate isomerase-like protein (cupin superfamily)
VGSKQQPLLSVWRRFASLYTQQPIKTQLEHIMNFRIRNLVSASQTGSNLSVFAEVTTPGFGPPLHSHTSQLELFHIIKGQYKFRLGDQEFVAGPGECVLIPVGTTHTFKNIDSEDGLIHFELLPSGTSEAFFARLVADFDGIGDMGAFFQEHGLELLGPPIA